MADTAHDARDVARKRIEERRNFVPHLLVYLVVNTGLVLLWLWSGGDGFFWPGVVLIGWGIGVLMHAWNVFFNKPITDTDVDHELARMGYPTEDGHPWS